MKNVNSAIVSFVAPKSIAGKAGIQKGDIILSLNGSKMQDILDYHLLVSEPLVVMEINRDGQRLQVKIKKDAGKPLGIDFTGDLFDGIRQCRNRCKFCFVYQAPKGMRKPLYIMDDDYRLSFLYGSFITLTNLNHEDKARIKRLRLSPLYVSVHATDPDVRQMLMEYRKDADCKGDPITVMKEFIDAGIELHTQVVCCPGINDGIVLKKTIDDLAALYPGVGTLAIVPVGLTKYRNNLYKISSYTKKEAESVITMVIKKQRKFKKILGTRFVFLSDEWFRVAEKEPPGGSHYEGFPQLDNGVGMLSLWKNRFNSLKYRYKNDNPLQKSYSLKDQKVTIFTSPLAASLIKEASEWLSRFKGISVSVVVGKHYFWGDTVTIAGLFTSYDVKKNLRGIDLGDLLCLPSVITKDGKNGKVLLDDCHIKDLEKEMGVPIALVPYLSPNSLLKAVIMPGR